MRVSAAASAIRKEKSLGIFFHYLLISVLSSLGYGCMRDVRQIGGTFLGGSGGC